MLCSPYSFQSFPSPPVFLLMVYTGGERSVKWMALPTGYLISSPICPRSWTAYMPLSAFPKSIPHMSRTRFSQALKFLLGGKREGSAHMRGNIKADLPRNPCSGFADQAPHMRKSLLMNLEGFWGAKIRAINGLNVTALLQWMSCTSKHCWMGCRWLLCSLGYQEGLKKT